MHHIFFATEFELEDHKKMGHTKTRMVNISFKEQICTVFLLFSFGVYDMIGKEENTTFS